jgi:hypothetical protein
MIKWLCVLIFVFTTHLCSTFPEDWTNDLKAQALISLAQESLAKANRGESKLKPDVLSIQGMSSPKIRYLLNNLCSQSFVNYLEIGSYKGSTLVSALYRNDVLAIAIDNWSEFGNHHGTLQSNLRKFIPNARLSIYDTDCFQFDIGKIREKINVYLYDGNHSEQCQEAAFTYFNNVLDDVFIAIVDDWNWDDVRNGTFSAFRKLNYSILFEQELFTRGNSDTSSWWNGIYIAVIQKK